MRKFVIAALASTMFAVPVFADPAPPAAAPMPPSYGSFGFDTAGMDTAVAPGENFFDYADGGWVKATTIPADKAAFGMFTVLDDLSKQRTQGILKAELDNPSSKIGNAYASYLDLATVEAKGLAPIRPWLDHIKALTDKTGYPALVAEAVRNGVRGPFGFGVEQDDKDPQTYAIGMSQSGLGLPDRD
jgi:putative endopeptidase